MEKERFIHSLKNYTANIILIWLAILFYRTNKYYIDFLRPDTQTVILYLALIYTVVGFFVYIFFPSDLTKRTKGRVLAQSVKRMSREYYRYLKEFTSSSSHPLPKIDKEEKTAFLFLIVKIFFLPIMLNFMFSNYNGLKGYINILASTDNLFSVESFINILYPFAIVIMFFIDTLYFTFGYAVEAKFLGNTVRSVEPTIFGWIVALACYPPFNGLVSDYVSWYANDSVNFATSTITVIMRIVIIILFIIYLGATLSLGAKCSNLTNRGIVSRGTYSWIRHPAYISKVGAWWLMIIPVFSLFAFVSMALWTGVYFLRAITEERHLIQDPDYVQYCKKVKWRFIPGIY
ncbi:MAG: hypothetical protein KKF56_03090 [Nanoarchaeota archaeon]|nr:hypothetical protein [Nanoarchaeota archaeon]